MLRKDQEKSSNNIGVKFIVDGMHGKLARWLRLIGVDAEYSNKYTDHQLLNRALRERRVLLTSDAELHLKARSKGIDSFLINIGEVSESIVEVVKHYNLNFRLKPEESRCPKCGSNLRPVLKDEVKGHVPAKSYQLYEKYWTCTNLKCKKIYWMGSHWKNIGRMVEKIENLLKTEQM